MGPKKIPAAEEVEEIKKPLNFITEGGDSKGKMSSSRKRFLEDGNEAAGKKKEKVTQPQRPHHGLYNQGATCYLNSVLQVLSMTPEIHDRLDSKSRIDKELKKIFVTLEETTCGTESITKLLNITNVYKQSDAAECLEMILNKVSPDASEFFQGELTYSTKCSKGHIINEETNPFWTLPLTLKDTHDTNYSVENGFEMIFKTKSFSGDNAVYCNDCRKYREATSECEMEKSPQILTLLLKRFDFDYNTMSHFKSDCCVDVPSSFQRENKKYRLYGMVNHMGTLTNGHYTATVLSSEDRTWYEFNDMSVNKVEEPFAKNSTHSSITAYLLVYRDECLDKGMTEKGKQRSKEKDDENCCWSSTDIKTKCLLVFVVVVVVVCIVILIVLLLHHQL